MRLFALVAFGLVMGCGAAAHGPRATEPAGTLLYFWGVGCPFGERARPFVEQLEKDYPRVTIERIEVWRDAVGRKRIVDEGKRLGITSLRVPMFVYADGYVMGYLGEVTEDQVREMLGDR
jgi:hypothetical protein